MPLFFETTLADVDTLKCAAVRTLRRRTKAPLLGEGTCRARGTDVTTSPPRPCSRDLGSFALRLFGYQASNGPAADVAGRSLKMQVRVRPTHRPTEAFFGWLVVCLEAHLRDDCPFFWSGRAAAANEENGRSDELYATLFLLLRRRKGMGHRHHHRHRHQLLVGWWVGWLRVSASLTGGLANKKQKCHDK